MVRSCCYRYTDNRDANFSSLVAPEVVVMTMLVVVVILFPTEYKQCITAYMNNNIKNKTT